jgi:Cyclic nucleotide-binding domain
MLHPDHRTRQVVAALQDVALFRGRSEAEMCALAGQVVRRRYGRHTVLFAQGRRGDGLYIVTHGHVGISRQGPEGDELLLALCSPSEYFGELALFDAALRAALTLHGRFREASSADPTPPLPVGGGSTSRPRRGCWRCWIPRPVPQAGPTRSAPWWSPPVVSRKVVPPPKSPQAVPATPNTVRSWGADRSMTTLCSREGDGSPARVVTVVMEE